MARKQPKPVRFDYTLPVEVQPVPFVMLESVKHLDVAALEKARQAEVEIGYFDTGCHQMVRASIKKGNVTGLRVDPCSEEEAEPASPQLRALLDEAFRRVRDPRPWEPVPISEFAANIRRGIQIDTITCVRICIFGFCFVCCTTIDPNVPFWCGKRVIIHRD